MSNEFLLPKNFQPLQYKIWITNLDVENNTFNGNVSIALKTNKPNNTIQFHTRDIEISDAWVLLNGSNDKISMVSHSYDTATEFVTMAFPQDISTDCALYVEYNGKLQSNMSGFYRSNYKDASTSENKWMLSTQFEATDARRAFPCFDEPNLKAHFEIYITAASNLTVLSNMPEKETISEGSNKTHIFHVSPLMSTYLVAWAVGEFEYIESETDKNIYPTLEGYNITDGSSKTKHSLPIRLYTAVGKSHQGEFAMGIAKKVVDLFSELFEIPYPLPKLDILCVESYSHNAMENFSLITFRPSALLYDGKLKDASTSSAAKKIAYVVSHEIAHQWFGNLVTMNWWDELWLNEGFATWVGYYAVAHLFPEWNVPSMVMLQSREVALGLDSLSESHPVKVNVHDPKAIDQVFDTISYLKGCSVLEMMSGYLGEATFLKGVALYLKRNKFHNATMDDLFKCISEVSGVDMLARIKPWILDIGYPILNVERSNNLLQLSQERYLPSSGKKPVSANDWWIPLMMTKGNTTEGKLEFNSKNMDIGYENEMIFFNTDGYGFYRINYKSPELLQEITKNLSNLSSRSQMALISDVSATGSLKEFFDLSFAISKVDNLDDFFVWQLIEEKLSTIRTIIYNHCDKSLIKKYDKFCFCLFEPLVKPSVEYLLNPEHLLNDTEDIHRQSKAELYDIVLEFTGRLSHPDVVKTALEIFNANKVNASNRYIVLGTVLSQPNTTKATFDSVVEKLANSELDELETIVSCLGGVRNEDLFQSCLELLFKIEEMNVQYLATSFGKNPYIHKNIIKYVREHKRELFDRLKINGAVIARFVSFTFAYFSGAEFLTEIMEIFEGEDVSLYDRNLRQTLEKVKLNTSSAQKRIPLVSEYFQ